jgi:cell division protein FtsB
MGESEEGTTPDEQLRRLFGQAEKQTADAVEDLVHRDAFGELLARTTENVMALTKIGFGTLDLVVRNLRLAGRPDLLRLGKQLARNEDKLEQVLQEVEQLQDQVKDLEPAKSDTSASSSRRRSASSSSKNGSSARRKKSSSGSRSKSSS